MSGESTTRFPVSVTGPQGEALDPAFLERLERDLRTHLIDAGALRVDRLTTVAPPMSGARGDGLQDAISALTLVVLSVQTTPEIRNLVAAIRRTLQNFSRLWPRFKVTIAGVDPEAPGGEQKIVNNLLAAPGAPLPVGTKRALIIVNSIFDDPKLPRLDGPESDAVALQEVLGDPAIGGFTVEVISNQTLREIDNKVFDFFDSADSEDFLLLHYSGHGLQDRKQGLVLATWDTRRSNLTSTLPASSLVDRMGWCAAGRIVLILDCCHAGAVDRGGGGPIYVPSSQREAGKYVLAATSSTDVAFEMTFDPRSATYQPAIFTGALVEGLRTGAADTHQLGKITLQEMYEYAGKLVEARQPGQRPQLIALTPVRPLTIANNPNVKPTANLGAATVVNTAPTHASLSLPGLSPEPTAERPTIAPAATPPAIRLPESSPLAASTSAHIHKPEPSPANSAEVPTTNPESSAAKASGPIPVRDVKSNPASTVAVSSETGTTTAAAARTAARAPEPKPMTTAKASATPRGQVSSPATTPATWKPEGGPRTDRPVPPRKPKRRKLAKLFGAATAVLVVVAGIYLGIARPWMTPAADAAGRDVVVGVDLPFRGTSKAQAEATFNAMQIYLASQQGRAGKHRVTLRRYDNTAEATAQWDEGQCIRNAKQHVSSTDEVAVMGTFNSGCAKAQMPTLNGDPAGPMLMLSHANTSLGLTKASDTAGEPQRYAPSGRLSYARVIPPIDVQGAAAAQLAKELGASKCLVMSDGTAYGWGTAAGFSAAAKVHGIETLSATWNAPETSYLALFAEAKAAAVNCVYLGGSFDSNGAQLVKDKVQALGDHGVVRIFAPDEFRSEILWRQGSLNNAYLTHSGIAAGQVWSASTAAKNLLEKYKATHKSEPPTADAFYGAVALQVLLAAIEASDGTRHSVRNQIFENNGITVPADRSLTGYALHIDPGTGDITTSAVSISQISAGKEIFLRTNRMTMP